MPHRRQNLICPQQFFQQGIMAEARRQIFRLANPRHLAEPAGETLPSLFCPT